MGLFSRERPEPVQLGDVTLHCEICKGTEFWTRDAQLNTAVASFFSLEWTNPTASCFICSQCGYIHWFLPLD